MIWELVRTIFLMLMICAIALVASLSQGQVSVWTYHNDNQRTGLNTNETILNLTNVNSSSFGKLFSYAVDGYVYAEPLYLPNVNIHGRGVHNVVFIATEHNTVYAFDADDAGASGGLLWKTNLGPSAVTTVPGVFTNRNFGTRYNGDAYTDIEPEVGITGTPVIDTNSGTLYVDAFTGVVGVNVTNYFHTMHALNITNGAEQPYSPVNITASVPGVGVDSVDGVVTFNAQQENQRPALTLAGGILYVAYAGYADTDPYHGWIIGFNAANLMILTNYVFNVTPNSTTDEFGGNAGEGGIWMGGCGLAVDDQTNIYVNVANGSFNVTNGSGNTEYGDSMLKLATSNGLSVVDYFTPWNQAEMQELDKDLGSGGIMLLPDQPGAATHEMIGAGKFSELYLLNRDQLTTDNGHFDASDSVDNVWQPQFLLGSGAMVFDTPAYFNGNIYYCAASDVLRAIPLINGFMSGGEATGSRFYSFPGATPAISANGTDDGIVWTLQKSSTQILVANNAANVSLEIYNSANNARDALGGAVKFAVPTVADGRVFVGGSNSVAVFGLLAGSLSFTEATFSVVKGNTDATITVSRLGGTNGAVQVAYATVAGGTAIAGTNYTSVSGVLNWADGESGSKTFTVPILNDRQVVPNETVDLALSDPMNGAVVGPEATAMLTITTSKDDVRKLMPKLAITAPRTGAKTSNEVYAVTGTASGNLPVTNVMVSVNDGDWMLATMVKGWSNWSYSADLTAGNNMISAVAVDTAGLVSKIDTVKLVYVLTAPITVETNGYGVIGKNYNGDNLIIGDTYAMTAKPKNGFKFVKWTDGDNTTLTTHPTLKFEMTSNLVFVAVFEDGTRPTVKVTGPKANAKMTGPTVTITGAASDNAGVMAVQCRVNNGDWTAATGPAGFATWTAADQPIVTGANTVQTYAVDAAGNISATNTVKFTGLAP